MALGLSGDVREHRFLMRLLFSFGYFLKPLVRGKYCELFL
jgi:hypothetical protein